MQIFISHSSNNADAALKICEFLEDTGQKNVGQRDARQEDANQEDAGQKSSVPGRDLPQELSTQKTHSGSKKYRRIMALAACVILAVGLGVFAVCGPALNTGFTAFGIFQSTGSNAVYQACCPSA